MKLRRLLIITLLTGCISAAYGQLTVGSWKIYSSFSGVEKIVDTPDKIYYVSTGQLYVRDKDNDETYNYTSSNRLSDSSISNIYYNNDKKYLLVAYSNSNIDIIDDDDVIYNMPDIKDATLDVVAQINDVKFDNNKIYVATNFGIVVFDYKKKEVITAGNYNKNITSVEIVGDKLWLIESFRLYNVDKDKNLTSVSAIEKENVGHVVKEIKKMAGNNNQVVVIAEDGTSLDILSLEPGNLKVISRKPVTNAKNLQVLSDGSILCQDYKALYTVGTDGTVSTVSIANTDMEAKKVGSAYENKNIGSFSGIDELWLGSDAGLACYSLEDGTLTVKSQASRPDAGFTFANVGDLKVGKNGTIYVANFGYSELLKDLVNPGHSAFYPYNVNKIQDGEIIDITPTEYTLKNKNHRGYNVAPVGFKCGYKVLEDITDPEYYFLGSFWDGLYRFKDGVEVNHYYEDNSTLKCVLKDYRLQLNGMDYDKNGNLWVATLAVNDGDKVFHMLPNDKIGKQTEVSDWQVLEAEREVTHDGKILGCKHSDNVFYTDAIYKGPISIIKTKGTTTMSDDVLINSSEIVDQDGLLYSYNYIYSMAEDQKGRVWIGTDNGIVEITRPDDITGSTFNVNHLKVPRRDGTNFADYLLDGEIIYCIAIDPANRKWITTARSGVYLVSEDGDEILEHFDPTNSPLPSYAVFAAVCGNNNDVYFGTGTGLLQYNSTAAPARENYSEVYAYPNPVRPEYTGWITIAGLMENSLVKIADAAGNVFFQGTSEGGMLVWDGCDRSGKRVKTGVYYVFASHGGDGMENDGAVTKILVVN